MCSPGQHRMFFPNNIQLGFKARGKRPKAQAAAFGGIDQLIQSEGIAQALFYK